MQISMKAFDRFPAQKAVALLMLRTGVRLVDDVPHCGDIEVADTALGRAAGVDRRVVRSAIERICRTPYLYEIFARLRPISLLADASSSIGCSALDIMPTDPSMPGILYDISGIILDAGVSIRQAVVEDSPEGEGGPHLVVVLDGALPPEYIPRLVGCRGVRSVTVRRPGGGGARCTPAC